MRQHPRRSSILRASRPAGFVVALACSFLIVGCGGGDSGGNDTTPVSSANALIQKATCASGDHVETGIQGQIPMADISAGFKGFNCNLQTVATKQTSTPYGYLSQFAMMHDRNGHVCGYVGTAIGGAGTTIFDLTDPANPVETGILTTSGMLNPGEGLRTHEGRGLLVAAYYNNYQTTNDANHGFDVYDAGTDCRHPQLLASTVNIPFSTAGYSPWVGQAPYPSTDRVLGHEGAISPDGMTYYISDIVHGVYFAMDISDPTAPKLVSQWQNPGYVHTTVTNAQAAAHGLSISDDGNAGYMTTESYDHDTPDGLLPTTADWGNGFLILDTSEVQARKPDARMKLVGSATFKDGAAEQMTIPVKIAGKSYVITVGESGAGSAIANNGLAHACAAGAPPYSMPRIYDVTNPAAPILVRKVLLETNNSAAQPDVCTSLKPNFDAGAANFNSHMCSVDDRDNATTLTCSYWQSGIRVFDIRDPVNVKEIAYYSPPAAGAGKAPQLCAALPFLDAEHGTLFSSCADVGVLALKFNPAVWPFPMSQTPLGHQL
ncbi:LVIVD repeat-containing protein [Paraburkholderia youngii]|uniref:LVIVD repeat-containing protein n=1 Tax=Paraburkholderia youngii TaxID=2782701 RepID=UPI00159146D4|nr:hypothetical protein [Paraburkholderia youngii]NUX57620.1 hypothetical protein [Paraburkholderia youngii]